MKVKSESEVAQSCPTLSDPMDCSLPGSSVMGFARQEYWSGVPLPSPNLSIVKFYCNISFQFIFELDILNSVNYRNSFTTTDFS